MRVSVRSSEEVGDDRECIEMGMGNSRWFLCIMDLRDISYNI